MATDVSLRGAGLDDREFLFELHRASRDPMWRSCLGLGTTRFKWEFFDRWFRPEHTFIISAGGEDVGVVAFESRDDEVYVSRIEVHPEQQNKGIGTAVMSELVDRAHGAGMAVALHLYAINPSLEFYRRLGFTVSDAEEERPRGRFSTEYFPVIRPPASGVYAMRVTPSSRHASSTPFASGRR
ncbi:MAG: GNAT family N-acetyltransferase [Acidimicrobiia bacterium]